MYRCANICTKRSDAKSSWKLTSSRHGNSRTRHVFHESRAVVWTNCATRCGHVDRVKRIQTYFYQLLMFLYNLLSSFWCLSCCRKLRAGIGKFVMSLHPCRHRHASIHTFSGIEFCKWQYFSFNSSRHFCAGKKLSLTGVFQAPHWSGRINVRETVSLCLEALADTGAQQWRGGRDLKPPDPPKYSSPPSKLCAAAK